MSMKTDEASQLAHVRSDLEHRFEELPEVEVRAAFDRAVQAFSEARIRAFVPVMVQKKVTESLRFSQRTDSHQ